MIFNMKRITNLAILALLGLSSCTQEFTYDPTQEIKENAENIFGLIDPNQDWRTTTSGTVTVTADAPLSDITKVQILTESPFFNDQAKILSEAEVTAGQTVTLSYDAPRSNTRVIAACVDSNGKYYIQGFNIGDENVSFKSSSAPAATRAAVITRSGSELPNISLDFNESFLSYNAQRTLSNNNNWKDKNWENDRLWQPTGESSNGWTISNSTIYRDATALTEDEAATLKDIFDASLGRYNNDKTPRNNLQYINESSIVQLYGNHLESNGKAALTLCPVQAASTEAYWCDIYYYYYRTEDIPSGTTEADYIKALPKFKAIDVNDVRQAFSTVTGIAKNVKDERFLRQREYLLPFYGNASEFTPMPSTLKTYGYTTDEKFYRISNYSGKSDAKPEPIPESNHYITYADKLENLKDDGAVDIKYQLWQIFTNANDNTVMLYNVGSGKFLRWENNADHVEFLDITEKSLKNYTIYITDGAKNPYAFEDITKQKVFILSSAKNNFIKARIDTDFTYLNKGGTNISGDYLFSREWTFEDYTDLYEGSAEPISDIELSLKYFPAGSIAPPSTKPSTIIPEGYRIGFMVRKEGGKSEQQGCVYGYGALNTEINQYGQFKNAVDIYGMEPNSPRIATFTANNTIYLCFEEGTDAQYSDIIVEVGSPGETGVDMSNEDLVNVEYMSYMMCFEDSPKADYDLNDVVLKFQRKNDTEVKVSLVACGAYDELYLRGLEGGVLNGNTEIHEYFSVDQQTYINTDGSTTRDPITEIFNIDANTPTWTFISNVYIIDKTTGGNEIRLSGQGDSPCAIIVPGYINYPMEKVCITEAYPDFKAWVNNATENRDWYKNVEEKKVYKVTSNKVE
jgi:hypothetical protein